jgi:hypothetical protein
MNTAHTLKFITESRKATTAEWRVVTSADTVGAVSRCAKLVIMGGGRDKASGAQPHHHSRGKILPTLHALRSLAQRLYTVCLSASPFQ